MVNEIQELAERLGRAPKKREYTKEGEFSATQVESEFGSWSKGVSESGVNLSYPSTQGASKKELLEELDRLYEKLGQAPTIQDLSEHGRYSTPAPYVRVFGSWNKAVKAAGFEPNGRIPRLALVMEFVRLKGELGHIPSEAEVTAHGTYSLAPYRRVFGSWPEAQHQLETESRRGDRGELRPSLITEFQRIYRSMGEIPSRNEVVAAGKFSAELYEQEFESWYDVLTESGIGFELDHSPWISALSSELQNLHEELGRVPTETDIREKSDTKLVSYFWAFGGFDHAVEETFSDSDQCSS